jgi:RasGEF domain
MEWNLYKAVAPKELLGLAWSKKDAAERSPKLLQLIDRFNLVSNWVVVTLVREFDLKKRVKLLTHFVKICAEMSNMGNFNGVFEIVSGLHSSPADRLKHTWAGLSSKKRKLFETQLSKITHPSKNYEMYRGLLHSRASNIPTLPYVGMFLSDLTFIEEGNPSTILPKDVEGAEDQVCPENESIHMVNFYRYGLVANVIHLVQRFQQQDFVIEPVPFLAKLLRDVHPEIVEEKECYANSLRAEPREG